MSKRSAAALAASVLAASGLLATPAIAATPSPVPTPSLTATPDPTDVPTVVPTPTLPTRVLPSVSARARCGVAVLTVSSPSRLVRVEYRVDRGAAQPLRQFGPTRLPFAEDSDVHSVQWRLVVAGDPRGWSRPTLVQSNCRAGVQEIVECGRARLVVHASASRSARLWRHGDDRPEWRWVPPGQARTVELGPFGEDSGDHVISYRLWDGLRRGPVRTVTIKSDCRPPEPTPTPTPTDGPELVEVVPVEPSVQQPTCDTEGIARITIPAVKSVGYYTESGAQAEPGTYTVAPGRHEVTARPADGYAFPEGAKTAWTLTVDQPPAVCPGPPGEDGEDGRDGQDGRDGVTRVIVVDNVRVPTLVHTGAGGTA